MKTPMLPDLKDRVELLAMTGVACVGAFLCSSRHFCKCGHLAHGRHEMIEPWIIDEIWLFALVGAAVVGIKGRFDGARPIGITSSLMIVLIVISRSPLFGLGALVLFILFFVQIWELLTRINKHRKDSKQNVLE